MSALTCAQDELPAEERDNLKRAFDLCHDLCRAARGLAGADRRLWLRQDAPGGGHRQPPRWPWASRPSLSSCPTCWTTCGRPSAPPARCASTSVSRRCARRRLLVLDDLGTESASPWAQEKLYQLFNYRYNARLPTVITTAQTHRRGGPAPAHPDARRGALHRLWHHRAQLSGHAPSGGQSASEARSRPEQVEAMTS